MSESSPVRPRQVTLAAWLIMIGSVVVVAMVFDEVAGLHTLETRASIEKFLAEPPGADLGVGVDGVITLLRTFGMVAAGCATAAGILGYHVMRRSRSARLALTVLAVPLFLTGMVTGGFVSSVVAASAVILWMQPARDWFDGVTRSAPSAAAAAVPPPQVVGPGQAVWQQQPPPAAAPIMRPNAVVWACVLTWMCSAVAALGTIAAGIALAFDSSELLTQAREQNPELAQQGVTDAVLLGVTYAMVLGLVLWCVAAAVFAALVYRGVEWARIVLIVCAAGAAFLSLAGTVLGAFVLVLPMIGATVTAALLIRPDIRPWFAKRDTP